MPSTFSEGTPMPGRPLRLSEIKYSIYGGLRLDRRLDVGWQITPSIGMVAKDVNKLGLEIENFIEPIVRSIRLVMMPSIRRNFVLEGRPEEWEPLALYTQQVRGSARPILFRTGRLEGAAASFSIWTITPTSAAIQSLPEDVWYGAIHQEGYGSIGQVARKTLGPKATKAEIANLAMAISIAAEKGPNRRLASKFVIPARPFILFQDEDIEAIQDIFIEWMEAKADEVGRGWHVT